MESERRIEPSLSCLLCVCLWWEPHSLLPRCGWVDGALFALFGMSGMRYCNFKEAITKKNKNRPC